MTIKIGRPRMYRFQKRDERLEAEARFAKSKDVLLEEAHEWVLRLGVSTSRQGARSSLLRLREIRQIRRHLIFLRWHQFALGTAIIGLVADLDPGVVFRANVRVPDRPRILV